MTSSDQKLKELFRQDNENLKREERERQNWWDRDHGRPETYPDVAKKNATPKKEIK